jgi:hypothetical protein
MFHFVLVQCLGQFDGLVYISEVLFDLLEYLAVVGEFASDGLSFLGIELVEGFEVLALGDDLELARLEAITSPSATCPPPAALPSRRSPSIRLTFPFLFFSISFIN